MDGLAHIGLLDDDRGVRESLAFMLQAAGHEVTLYASADEFLHRCDLARLQGLILDQHMPDLTGLDIASRLRASEWQVPILLITARPSQDIVARANALGIEEVLTKPFQEVDIMAFVQRLTGRCHGT